MPTEPNFLGTRLDLTVEMLPDAYLELERRVGMVVDQFHDTRDEDTAYSQLAALKLQDEHGNVWTVGATTRRWMVKLAGSGRWVPGHPVLGGPSS